MRRLGAFGPLDYTLLPHNCSVGYEMQDYAVLTSVARIVHRSH